MELLSAINDSAFSAWVRESGSLFAYPAFITLHTIGLALVVGLSAIVALLMLGAAPATTLAGTRTMFPYIWTGFVVNAASGLVLVAADPLTMLFNPVMWTKFGFIGVAVVIVLRMQRLVHKASNAEQQVPLARSSKLLAAASLACWLGAIVTGRLTAYIGPVAGLLVE